MAYCKKCGGEIGDEDVFCTLCGAPRGAAAPIARSSTSRLKITIIGFLIVLLTGAGFWLWKTYGTNEQTKLELAVKYIGAKNLDKAVSVYQDIIKANPKNQDAYRGLGLVYEMEGKNGQAQKALQEGLSATGEAPVLRLALAGLYDDMDRKDQAGAVYKELIKGSSYIDGYRAYNAMLMTVDMDEELALLEQGVQDHADYRLENLLAEACYNYGDEDKALEALKKSLHEQSEQSGAYSLLNQICMGSPGDMQPLAEQMIQEGDRSAGVLIKLESMIGQDKNKDLINEYQKWGAEVKNNNRARLLAARAYSALNRKSEASGCIKAIDPARVRDAGLLAEIADYYLDAGDKNTARKLALQGIQNDGAVIDNYHIMYRSYGGDKTWRIKYLLKAAPGLKRARDELLLWGDEDANTEISDSSPILEKVIYTPRQIADITDLTGNMFRPLTYLCTENGTLYAGYVFGNTGDCPQVMGFAPSLDQLDKPVVFRIHHPVLYDTKSVLNQLKKQYAESCSPDISFEEFFGQYKQVVLIESFYRPVYPGKIPLEERISKAGIPLESIIFVDIN